MTQHIHRLIQLARKFNTLDELTALQNMIYGCYINHAITQDEQMALLRLHLVATAYFNSGCLGRSELDNAIHDVYATFT